ncbi:MAG: antitoxin family protein [Pirellulales bacterium]
MSQHRDKKGCNTVPSLQIQAVYENGVLKPEQPLPLAEHQRVQVSIQTVAEQQRPGNASPSRAKATSGMLGWTGDAATVERLALDAEFGIEESP